MLTKTKTGGYSAAGMQEKHTYSQFPDELATSDGQLVKLRVLFLYDNLLTLLPPEGAGREQWRGGHICRSNRNSFAVSNRLMSVTLRLKQ